MSTITIFCKSYKNDLERAVKLVESIRKFNVDSLPLYFSVPNSDLGLFRERIGKDVIWLTDEAIIEKNPDISLNEYSALPGQLSQQIVKAEFWRLNPANNYLCVDSDCLFIRNFTRTDFIAPNDFPYTVMHEGKEFALFLLSHELLHVLRELEGIKLKFRNLFGRKGVSYNFGPFPVIWNNNVWRKLASDFLVKQEMTILDAIVAYPSEAYWYGEAILKFQSIPLMPREPLFKAYLFYEEFEHDKKFGVTEKTLADQYIGVVYQSNWYPKRLRLSKRFAYKIKKLLKKVRRVSSV